MDCTILTRVLNIHVAFQSRNIRIMRVPRITDEMHSWRFLAPSGRGERTDAHPRQVPETEEDS